MPNPMDSLTATPTPYETIESLMESITPFHQITFGQSAPNICLPETSFERDLLYATEKQPCFQQNFNLLTDDLHKRSRQDYRVFITASSPGQLARLDDILRPLQ